MVQYGLNSVTSWYPFCWNPASRCIPHLVPCQSGLWKLEKPAPLRGRDCFRHPYQARRTRRLPLSWRVILRGKLDRSFRPFGLWWLRPLCRHHRHRQFLTAVTMDPRKHLRRRRPQLQLQPRWGRSPGRTQCPCALDRRSPLLPRLSMTSWPHQALQRVSTYSCLGRRSPLRSRTPGGTRSQYRWTRCPRKPLQESRRPLHDAAVCWRSMLGRAQLVELGCLTSASCSEKSALPHTSTVSWQVWECFSQHSPLYILCACSGSPIVGMSLVDGSVCLLHWPYYFSFMPTASPTSLRCSVLALYSPGSPVHSFPGHSAGLSCLVPVTAPVPLTPQILNVSTCPRWMRRAGASISRPERIVFGVLRWVRSLGPIPVPVGGASTETGATVLSESPVTTRRRSRTPPRVSRRSRRGGTGAEAAHSSHRPVVSGEPAAGSADMPPVPSCTYHVEIPITESGPVLINLQIRLVREPRGDAAA